MPSFQSRALKQRSKSGLRCHFGCTRRLFLLQQLTLTQQIHLQDPESEKKTLLQETSVSAEQEVTGGMALTALLSPLGIAWASPWHCSQLLWGWKGPPGAGWVSEKSREGSASCVLAPAGEAWGKALVSPSPGNPSPQIKELQGTGSGFGDSSCLGDTSIHQSARTHLTRSMCWTFVSFWSCSHNFCTDLVLYLEGVKHKALPVHFIMPTSRNYLDMIAP